MTKKNGILSGVGVFPSKFWLKKNANPANWLRDSQKNGVFVWECFISFVGCQQGGKAGPRAGWEKSAGWQKRCCPPPGGGGPGRGGVRPAGSWTRQDPKTTPKSPNPAKSHLPRILCLNRETDLF